MRNQKNVEVMDITDYDEVRALAYDIPIIGYQENGAYNVNNAQFLHASVTTVAASNSEVFALTTSGALLEQTQRVGGGLSPNNWSQIGGNVATFAVSLNYNGRNEVFQVTTDHKLSYQTESVQGTYNPSAWYSISTGIYQVAVGNDANGDCQLFVINTAGHAYEKTEHFGATGYKGGPWTSFGSVTRIVTARNGKGAGEVFAVANDSSVWENVDVNDNGYANSPWYKIRTQIEA